MSVRSTHLKLVGAAGAAALAVGMVAGPAVAAASDITYLCTDGQPAPIGPVDSSLDPGTIPATLVAGQSVSQAMSLTVHLSSGQTAAVQTFGTSVNGTIDSAGPVKFHLVIPETAIDQTTGASQDVTATGTGTIRATNAGTYTVNAGDIAAVLNLTGGLAGPMTATQTCTAPTDGTQTLGTIAVSKDTTTTKVSAAYSAKRDRATGVAKIRSHYGLKPTGKVTFVLKRGTKPIAKAVAKVNSRGIARHVFTKVKKRARYTITAHYHGNSNLKGSSGRASFRVR